MMAEAARTMVMEATTSGTTAGLSMAYCYSSVAWASRALQHVLDEHTPDDKTTVLIGSCMTTLRAPKPSPLGSSASEARSQLGVVSPSCDGH